MSQQLTYKSRTVEVRNSAREHLKALRAQRMKKRRSGPVDDAVAAPPQHNAESAEAVNETGSMETEASFGIEVLCAEQTAEGDALNDLAVANAAMAEMTETGAEPERVSSSAADVVTAEPEAPQEDARDSEKMAAEEIDEMESVPEHALEIEESELSILPGAGPGLVWMLHQCGIKSLSDLAETAPEKLANDLGVVGQILDVSLWIDFAKNDSE